MRELGWELRNLKTLRWTKEGTEIEFELAFGSTALLHEYTKETLETKRWVQFRNLVEEQWKAEEGTIDTDIVREWIGSKKRSLSDKKVALQILGKSLVTNSWLHTHGWDVAGKCSCGQVDDIQHRISGCHRARGSDLDTFWANMRKAQNIPDPRPVKEEGFICFINGERVAAKDFSWDRNLPIFTDGSVAFPRWTRLSAGAGGSRPDPGPLHLGGE